MSTRSGYLLLPLAFDTVPLLQELAQLQSAQWLAHYNTNAYERGWHCLPLRSIGGQIDHVIATDSDDYAPTAFLERCPHFQRVLASFACELRAVRLMALAPGARILPHRDVGTSFDDGLARLHVPIRTDPAVVFHIDGETVHLTQGSTWYLDAGCLHGVDNDSSVERIHLVLDCVPNDWLADLMAQGGYVAPPAPRFGERNINQDNVAQVIAALRANGSPSALEQAARLEAA